ncbi:alpha/beta fold hydrolase [Mycobacterium sp. NAZ190054]|uniref:alpha/beta fold hydrolase n=1 Tax=Mycobacterium sp. NAZ190054 TaxID=1747766 RepID=UPI00079164F5|nr:alpha/beta hydrolase [Mycobacterium sp. NAZ190054]KWX68276.1 alpha/beta hydrolase [Mycobacterium sp. NAZ190054]
MPYAPTDDGFRLYYEEAGAGIPMVFVHEFGGDHRSWEPQMRHFSRWYRCITFAARGFPPSDVPADPAHYSQGRAAADIAAILDGAGVDKAYVVGNSMGGFAALHFALRMPERCIGAVVAGCGYGADPAINPTFRAESALIADAFENEGSQSLSRWYGVGPARVQFEAKDPRGHAEHVRILAEHDPVGAALTMRNVQITRPMLFEMTEELRRCETPVLIIAGDEDNGVLEADLMLKRTIPRAGLAILPRTGHVSNIEEPALFNHFVERFVLGVSNGTWTPRDPRSISASMTGAGTATE